ncbi:FAD dependent oxidoreductase [Hydrogenispora ethanolica]|uniref:FAD dependent oxidoreductase n=1 Tax=Hydrogenispora ethanolica TaxID=1082276 RepID=A0A4R1R861_HYDET|nr:FAD-dependent oxidoreductase [Hydrogenispora ethanolica]TCL61778.1 FAD dependent oxidoreductase [Hydrogenispora ethanolica]
MSYEVLIVGGGISGALAATAAARLGVRTLVVEQYGFLGGMLTAAGVGPMMTFHAGNKQVIQGLAAELVERLVSRGKSPGHLVDTTGYTDSVTPFDAEALKHELEMMVLESGAELLYHTMLAGATVAESAIQEITVCNKAGLSRLTAQVYIDATGDADLSAWAGVGFDKGRAGDGLSQPMTMNLKLRNVDIPAVRDFIKAHPDEFPRLRGETALIERAPRLSIGGFVKTLQAARDRGEITFEREDLLFFETNLPGEVIVNTARILGCDGTDPWSLSQAEIEGRRQIRELAVFLKTRVPGFANAEIVGSGPAIGVRGSRQIRGLYTLTRQDVLECRPFPDVVAHSGYPLDIHSPDGAGTVSTHLPWGAYYGIPYRCLLNAQTVNLITVGRCISATFEAQAAIRTTPTAGAIGHAGGVAAALAVGQGCRPADLPVASLQAALESQGAFIER